MSHIPCFRGIIQIGAPKTKTYTQLTWRLQSKQLSEQWKQSERSGSYSLRRLERRNYEDAMETLWVKGMEGLREVDSHGSEALWVPGVGAWSASEEA